MRIKIFGGMFIILSAFLLSSCGSLPGLSSGGAAPKLYPIVQGEGFRGKFGYINSKGEVVIQPQFSEAWFFSEDLAAVCIDYNKCGYIDETGKFVINPQFQFAGRFSEGLAAVLVEGKLGYIDKTGKFAINPQFQDVGNEVLLSVFSEGLAAVRIGDKVGFVDKTGKIVINPQFDEGLLFREGLAATRIGQKWGFIDKQGAIIINPQFELAHPFVGGLAAVKLGTQWGYVDKEGKIAINPQFDFAGPFAEEGAALVFLKDKAGYIDKQGKYIVNPQYSVPQVGGGRMDNLVLLALSITSDLSRLSFSEGLALANVGDSSAEKSSFGYADSTGKMVINPQFKLAFPFWGELALVLVDQSRFAWINKEGKIVWQQMKETVRTASNSKVDINVSAPGGSANTNTTGTTTANSAPPASSSPSSAPSERTGRLTTDSNVRSEPNKDAGSLGIHFKGAKLKILEETSYARETGEQTTWYRIKVYEYGCSVDTSLGCGKNSPGDSDEGWVNAKNVLLD